MTDLVIIFKDTLTVSDLACFMVDFQSCFRLAAQMRFGEDDCEEPYISVEVCGVTKEEIDQYLENSEIELYAKAYYIIEKVGENSDE